MQADTGVHKLIDDIGQEVHQHYPGGHYDDYGLDHREIPVADAADEQAAYAGDGKDLLHDYGAGHYLGHGDGQEGDDGDHGVAHHMAAQNGPPGIAAALSGTDVIALELVPDGAAQHLGGHGYAGDGNRQGGEDEVVEEFGPALGVGDELPGHKEPEGQTQDEAHDDAYEELGDAHEDLVNGREDVVEHLAADAAGHDAQGNGQRHRENERDQRQHRGHGQLVRQHLRHRQVIVVAGAEISMYEVGEPLPVADEHGPVQPQLGPEGGYLLRRGVHAQYLRGGITWDDGEGKEGEERNDQQCNNESKEFFHDIFHTPRLPSLCYARLLGGLVGIAHGGHIQDVQGIELIPLQSRIDDHILSQVLDIDVGGGVAEYLQALLVEGGLLGVILGGLGSLEGSIILGVAVSDHVVGGAGGPALQHPAGGQHAGVKADQSGLKVPALVYVAVPAGPLDGVELHGDAHQRELLLDDRGHVPVGVLVLGGVGDGEAEAVLVSRLRQQLLCLLHIVAVVVGQGGVKVLGEVGEHGGADLHTLAAGGKGHDLIHIDSPAQRLTHQLIVKGLHGVVQVQSHSEVHGAVQYSITVVQGADLVILQMGAQVDGTGVEGQQLRLGAVEDLEGDLVQIGGGAVVVGVLLDDEALLHAVRHKAEGAGADGRGALVVVVRRSDVGVGHIGQEVAVGLGQGDDDVIALCGDLSSRKRRGHSLIDCGSGAGFERVQHVFGGDGLSVVEKHAVTKREGISQAILRNGVGRSHSVHITAVAAELHQALKYIKQDLSSSCRSHLIGVKTVQVLGNTHDDLVGGRSVAADLGLPGRSGSFVAGTGVLCRCLSASAE